MVRNIGIALYLYPARSPYERMEIDPLPQECDERVTREVTKLYAILVWCELREKLV